MICCDFNAIFALEDKLTGGPNLEDLRCTNDLMQDLRLQHPSLVGRRFTWMNGQSDLIWVKLDYFIVNGAWMEHFTLMIQKSLPRLGSDHVSIRLEVGSHYSTPRFFNMN